MRPLIRPSDIILAVVCMTATITVYSLFFLPQDDGQRDVIARIGCVFGLGELFVYATLRRHIDRSFDEPDG